MHSFTIGTAETRQGKPEQVDGSYGENRQGR
jgi:hypothetical protein